MTTQSTRDRLGQIVAMKGGHPVRAADAILAEFFVLDQNELNDAQRLSREAARAEGAAEERKKSDATLERLAGLITEDDLAEGPANPEGAIEAVLYDTFAWWRERIETVEAERDDLSDHLDQMYALGDQATEGDR